MEASENIDPDMFRSVVLTFVWLYEYLYNEIFCVVSSPDRSKSFRGMY